MRMILMAAAMLPAAQAVWSVLAPTADDAPVFKEEGKASYYGDGFDGNPARFSTWYGRVIVRLRAHEL